MISTELLRRFRFFSGFTPEEIKELAMAGREITLKPGEVLFEEGARAELLYFLADGEMEILIQGDEEQIPISTLPPGEPIGYSAVIEPPQYTGTARATKPSRVVGFPQKELGPLLRDDHFTSVLMREIATMVNRRLNDTRVQLLSLAGQKP